MNSMTRAKAASAKASLSDYVKFTSIFDSTKTLDDPLRGHQLGTLGSGDQLAVFGYRQIGALESHPSGTALLRRTDLSHQIGPHLRKFSLEPEQLKGRSLLPGLLKVDERNSQNGPPRGDEKRSFGAGKATEVATILRLADNDGVQVAIGQDLA